MSNNKWLSDVINQKHENHILPFLWVHGEDEQTLRDRICKIHESGIRAVCIESRPHPDFVGGKWWKDMDILMDESKKRGMKLWVFDDQHFPTGYVAGKIKREYPEYQKQFIKEIHIDAVGPLKGASFFIDNHLGEGDELITVIATQCTDADDGIDDTLIDVTNRVKNGVLYWDVPQGYWRVFICMMTKTTNRLPDHFNMLVPEAISLLIDTVYESHYARYKDEFGKTFAGFFSDEPQFGNTKDAQAIIGKSRVMLPWSDELLSALTMQLGEDFTRYLPCLWHDTGAVSTKIQYTYMETVTQIYKKNMAMQIGNWCRAHGVEYIGHVIEDNNAHARLGPGTGHYFRSLWGQDMAGIDIVLQQVMPGYDTMNYKFGEMSKRYGDFYHYGLGKLGASLGHLDEKKKGRTLCEVFGANGWCEGLKQMKWQIDHLLVRGVNYFIPHAFTAKAGIDPDCPPHFYADGNNPQYRYFKHLMNYTNRLSNFISNGRHIASAAILYHAEAEWSGDCMFFQQPMKQLMQNQIDADIVSADILEDPETEVCNGKLCITNETFDCLIVPYAQALSKQLLNILLDRLNEGLEIIFIDSLPKTVSDGGDINSYLSAFEKKSKCQVICIDKIASTLKNKGYYDIQTDSFQPYLRYYHYKKEDLDIFMFFNEDPYKRISTVVDIPIANDVYVYRSFENTLSRKEYEKHNQQIKTTIELEAYESTVLVIGNGLDEFVLSDNHNTYKKTNKDVYDINGAWHVSLATSKDYTNFKYYKTINSLSNMSSFDQLPHFSGTFRYEITFNWSGDAKNKILDLGYAYETTEVWLNHSNLGSKICPPYRYNISDLLTEGENRLVIDVTNTLVKQVQDRFSILAMQEPSGLLGPVRIY